MCKFCEIYTNILGKNIYSCYNIYRIVMKGCDILKKNLIIILLIVAFFVLGVGKVDALYIGRNTQDQKLTLKTGPGNNYSNIL